MTTSAGGHIEKTRGWQTLLDFGKANDDKTLNDWKDELANLLTFTGLFSAVVTGFIVLAIPLLQEDSGEKSARLLEQISLQLSSFRVDAQFLNSTTPIDPGIAAPFEPDGQAVQINVLWIASLTLTLMASFFTISAQQWLRCIPLPPHLTIREAVRLRQFRQDGLVRWKVPTIISLLPVVVQISVVLFLVGLLLLLNSVNSAVATVFAIIAGSSLGLFTIMAFTPLLFASSPFKTPIIPTLVALSQLFAIPIVSIIFTIGWCLFIGLALGFAFVWALAGIVDRLVQRVLNISLHTRLELFATLPCYLHTISDGFSMSCAHITSAILVRCFSNTGQFWLSRELPITSDKNMDYDALSDAPTIVPKGMLPSLRPCLGDLGLDQRLRAVASWVRHTLGLTSGTALWLGGLLHSTTYTGPLRHAPPLTFTPLRETLWHVLPEAWDNEDKRHRSNRALSMMLCLLFRSIPETVDAGDPFLQEFGDRLFAIRDSQDYEKFVYEVSGPGFGVKFGTFLRRTLKAGPEVPENPTPHRAMNIDAATIPTTLLFHCCQRGFSLKRDQLVSASRWASSLHTYLLSKALGRHAVNRYSYARRRIIRMEELSLTSAAMVLQAVDRDITLLSNGEIHEAIMTLLHTSADIVHRFRLSLVDYTRCISIMRPGTHILACNQAIEVIARSLVRLAAEGHVAQTPDCPSRIIMSDFEGVCTANPVAFKETMAHLEEFNRVCGEMDRSGTSQLV